MNSAGDNAEEFLLKCTPLHLYIKINVRNLTGSWMETLSKGLLRSHVCMCVCMYVCMYVCKYVRKSCPNHFVSPNFNFKFNMWNTCLQNMSPYFSLT